MNIQPYKTHKIQPNEDLFTILDKYLPQLEEKGIVALASKIVGICEGRVVKKISPEQKEKLIKEEADYYLPQPRMGYLMTIYHKMLVVNAGIDESNSNGFLSFWPKDPQKSTNAIREYLCKKHDLKNLGVILTDSKVSPLRRGVTGYALAHSGFKALNSYIGKKDIYGEKMHVEQSNIADSLATAAVLNMGEGNEQQPLAVITDVPFVNFESKNPTQKELDLLKIKLEDDMYSSMLTAVKWKRGEK
ncbi:coenzyme F420-0:L-glutamate ligase [Candidatus Roizmanbacteria bacterium]|nr:coenzyme F420-0:L-glutamate ligase [Candidatus Roizmanbacteria bacterium]